MTAADTFLCDVGVRDGCIVALGNELGSAEQVIEAPISSSYWPASAVTFISRSRSGRTSSWPTISKLERARLRSAREVTGWPVLTMVPGCVVVRDGELVGDKGHGTYLPREIVSGAGARRRVQ